jgi:hypothetical protein
MKRILFVLFCCSTVLFVRAGTETFPPAYPVNPPSLGSDDRGIDYTYQYFVVGSGGGGPGSNPNLTTVMGHTVERIIRNKTNNTTVMTVRGLEFTDQNVVRGPCEGENIWTNWVVTFSCTNYCVNDICTNDPCDASQFIINPANYFLPSVITNTTLSNGEAIHAVTTWSNTDTNCQASDPTSPIYYSGGTNVFYHLSLYYTNAVPSFPTNVPTGGTHDGLLQVISSGTLSTNGFTFSITNTSTNCIVQASTNLSTWTNVGTATTNGFSFVDTNAGNFDYRFYRTIKDGLVYSAALGFMKITCPTGLSLIANQLNAPSNTVGSLLSTVPDFTTVNKYVDDDYVANTFAFGSWTDPDMTFAPGEGVFIDNGTNQGVTLTFIGNVLEGALVNSIPSGNSIRSSMIPQAGELCSVLNFPPPQDGQKIYLWDATNQTFDDPYEFVGDFAWWHNGSWSGEPEVGIGMAFFLESPSAQSWERTFSVGP